ncbi:MAG TPA: dicarboxylate/amino acid:cation symporter [Bdellovibrionota bacterium]|nr:dicarboxylate/amino acid:cation symporter [Bdellovibrionota bacterium]
MHKKQKRPWAVLIAIVLAIFVGSYVGKEGTLLGVSLYTIFDTVGSIFLNALTLVVVPLVSSSIISGIARVGGDGNFGRLGVKIFSFYIGTSLLAILIGLTFVNLIAPGHNPTLASASIVETEQIRSVQEQISGHEGKALINILVSIIPSNIVSALSHGEMLGLIFFSLIFGYAISKVESQSASILKGFFQGLFQAMIHFTHIIMKFLPYGVFCLVAKVFMVSGAGTLASVSLFSLTVLLGLATFMFIALPLLLKWIGRVRPLRHFKAMGPALITAFSTSSSSATLPITIDCVEKRAGVSNRICSLVVPLGTSINMSGSALYECVAAMFIAQIYGIELSFSTQFLVVMTALIASMGVAGIPSASLVAILIILKVIGLPTEGIGLIVAVDRLLDMCRTTVNVFSDSCCAVLVARTEGESKVLAQDVFENEGA